MKLEISDYMKVQSTEVIRFYEGLELEAYRCSADVLTIGYGHTGDDVYEGQVITPEEAEILLKGDLEWCEDVINNMVKVEINQNMFDALVSFVFNIGSGNFSNSTLLKLLNKGDYIGASNEFGKWRKAGGQILQGLVKRRAAEKELFLS